MKRLIFLFFTCTLFAQDTEVTMHMLRNNQKTPVTLKKIELCSYKHFKKLCRNSNNEPVVITDLSLPGNEETLKNTLLDFIDNPISEKLIQEIKIAIIEYYSNNYRPIITVYSPPQEVTKGKLKLIVNESNFGELIIKNNKWTNSSFIEKNISLEKGDVINTDTLYQDLYFLNRNPFRQIDAIYTPGKNNNETDIELYVFDRFPLRAYLGMANNGNNLTGNNRLFTGFTFGNMFQTGQILTYQYTASDDFEKMQAHTFRYLIPFFWRHEIDLYGGYSTAKVKYNIGTDHLESKGENIQGSLRYIIPLHAYARVLQEMFFGFDFKRTNNNYEYSDTPIAGRTVNLTQIMLAYNIGYKTNNMDLTVEIEGFYSPGKFLPDQSSSKFESLRAFAKNHYFYSRLSSVLSVNMFKNWRSMFFVRGQIATQNLLPSEEYGLGGFDTIRGFSERKYNGDNAIIFNYELHTPKFSILKIFTPKAKDELEFLAFFDWGYISQHKFDGLGHRDNIAYSVGPGMRYNITPYLTSRLDYGFGLSKDKHKLHFSVNVGF